MSSRWPDVPLGEVVENCNARRVPIKSADREKRAGEYPYYGASGIIDTIDDYLFDGEHLLIGEDGANLIARSTPIAFRAHGKFWVNNHAHVVRFNGKADLRFLEHYFTTLDLTPYVTGSAQPKLTRENLDRIPVPLPPLPEQRRIADILDKADTIRRKRKEAITLTEELLRSAFLEMFGDPVRNEKGWPEISLEGCAERITKGESPGWQGFDYQDHGVRFVTSENVLWGHVDLAKAKFIPETFDEKIARSRLHENDVLVNLVGASIGRTAIVPAEALPANINQAVAVISLKTNKLLPTFLLHQLLTVTMQRRLLGNIVDAARANISLTNIRDLKVILPPCKDQLRWEKFASNMVGLVHRYQHAIAESNHLFSSLVDRAFRGELTSPSTPSSPKRKQLGLFGD